MKSLSSAGPLFRRDVRGKARRGFSRKSRGFRIGGFRSGEFLRSPIESNQLRQIFPTSSKRADPGDSGLEARPFGETFAVLICTRFRGAPKLCKSDCGLGLRGKRVSRLVYISSRVYSSSQNCSYFRNDNRTAKVLLV